MHVVKVVRFLGLILLHKSAGCVNHVDSVTAQHAGKHARLGALIERIDPYAVVRYAADISRPDDPCGGNAKEDNLTSVANCGVDKIHLILVPRKSGGLHAVLGNTHLSVELPSIADYRCIGCGLP